MEENRKKAFLEAGLETDKKDPNEDVLPYIMNISEDPSLAGMLMYKLKKEETKLGTN